MAVNLAFTGNLVSEISQSREMRDALQFLTREKQWITETQLQLCRIPAPTFLEQKRAEWMLAQFRTRGCEAHLDRAGNVIAFPVPPAGDRPLIAVTAHLDTVLAPRRDEEVFIDSDGKLRGPGVSDNGAGLVALLALARNPAALTATGNQTDIVLIANVGEEGEGNLSGMRFLLKQSSLAARFAVFLVIDGATTDHIITRALGSRRFDLTFSGNGGHSWSDYGIGNPVHALARAISLFTDTRLTDHRNHGGPRSSINVGVVEGGPSVTSIPTQARAKVDIRSESNDKIDELVAVLHDSVERAQDIENQRASSGKVSARIKEIGSRPAAKLAENSPILLYTKAVDSYLGIRAHLECSSTDANLPLSMNIPALSIGAGGQGGGAHTPLEWFNPEGRDLGLKRVLLTAALLARFGVNGQA